MKSETPLHFEMARESVAQWLARERGVSPYRALVMAHEYLAGIGLDVSGVERPTRHNEKHTTESFIAKARAKHGDRYDYSKVEYVDAATVKVEIVCRAHGSFWQTPQSHLSGSGCTKCFMDSFRVMVGGETYASFSAAGKALGVKGETAKRWVDKHGPTKQFVKPRVPKRGAACRVGGVNYKSIKAAAAAHGVSDGTMTNWIKREDTETPFVADRTTAKKPCVVAGVWYESWTAAAKAYGVTYATIGKWVEEHSPDEPFRLQQKKACRVAGVDYESFAAAAAAHGVSHAKIVDWLETHGPDEPLKMLEKNGPKPCRLGGVEYGSYTAAAAALGITGTTVGKWIKRFGTETPFVKTAAHGPRKAK